MAGYNRIIMVGNLTRDPELKTLPSGQQVCRLGIASNRQFKNRQTGMMAQEVCFVDVDVWGPQAEHCKNYLQKGRPVLIEGRLKLDSWKEADGSPRSKHSIVADRVVFLSAGQGAETASFDGLGEDLGAVEAAPVETAPKRARKSSADQGIGVFKDEAPFGDDLPF